MSKVPVDFGLLVPGAGLAGLDTHLTMNRLKLRVLLIDCTAAAVDGDCLNRAYVASKILIHASPHAS